MNKIFTIFLTIGSIMASEIETPEYQLLEKSGQFEIRMYEPMIIAITNISSSNKSIKFYSKQISKFFKLGKRL